MIHHLTRLKFQQSLQNWNNYHKIFESLQTKITNSSGKQKPKTDYFAS